jgi:hypothetical protein
MNRPDAPVSEPDVPVDMTSIMAIRSELYRRWAPMYFYLVMKIVPIASLCGLIVHWALVWLTPGADHISAVVLPMVTGLAALLLCVWSLPSMLWLDFKIGRRLDDMARRIAAGETVYANHETR